MRYRSSSPKWGILLSNVFLHRYGQRIITLTFWLALIGLYQWYMFVNELTTLAVVRQLFELMHTPFYGPLIFVLFYTLQPLIFFPSWLLTVGAGYLYGPVWGLGYTLVASNLSSIVAYWAGRYFGNMILAFTQLNTLVRHYARRMEEKSFETVLLLRLLFLPYDIVSYLAGFLNINWKPFIIATIIGSLPGTLAFVLFGASIEGDFRGQELGINPWVLGASVALFILSIAAWHYVKRYILVTTSVAPPSQPLPPHDE